MRARPSQGPNLYFAGALCLFVLAGVLMAIAVWKGEAQAGIFLIFPYISGGGLFLGLGMLLVIVGFVVMVLGSVKRFGAMTFEEVFEDEVPARKKKQRPRTVGDQEVDAPRVRGGFKGGGVVFIGPVPIVFGPDVKVTKLMLYLSIVLVIALCLLFFALSYRGL